MPETTTFAQLRPGAKFTLHGAKRVFIKLSYPAGSPVDVNAVDLTDGARWLVRDEQEVETRE